MQGTRLDVTNRQARATSSTSIRRTMSPSGSSTVQSQRGNLRVDAAARK